MSFWHFNDREGPGVSGDEPRKTGLARLAEVFGRDGWSMCKAGLTALPTAIPWCITTLLSVAIGSIPLAALGGLLGGAAAAPQVTGILDTALRALRDEPGVWWLTYKEAWKRNWKASLLPGAVSGLLYALMVYALFHLNTGEGGLLPMTLYLVWVLLTFGLGTCFWPQIALYDMGPGSILRNAALMLMRFPVRTLAAAVIQLAYWALILLYYPYTVFVLPITGLWFPLFLSTFLVYAPMNEAFGLEDELKRLSR